MSGEFPAVWFVPPGVPGALGHAERRERVRGEDARRAGARGHDRAAGTHHLLGLGPPHAALGREG